MPIPKTISDLLQEGTFYLEEKTIPQPRREAELLLCALLSVRRIDLYLDPRQPVPSPLQERFQSWLDRRGVREPIQYILGQTDFFGIPFFIERGVFIPRPETEMIVEAALTLFPPPARILDLCTGSGALAVALAKQLPSAQVVATDLSEKALAVARRNAERHDCRSRILFVRGDLLEPLQLKKSAFDLIVCNPPYIPERDRAGLQPEVRDYEPEGALFASEEGTAFYRRILREAPPLLEAGGHLLLELGDGQARRLERLMNERPDWNVAFLRDLAGIDRIALCSPASAPAAPDIQKPEKEPVRTGRGADG